MYVRFFISVYVRVMHRFLKSGKRKTCSNKFSDMKKYGKQLSVQKSLTHSAAFL